jgi:hydrogenase maturation protease
MGKPTSMTNDKILIIGYGNSLRGDDGVGRYLAELIAFQEWQQVRTLSVHQLTPELAVEIATAKGVIFVDAVASESSTVEILPLKPVETGVKLGHYQDPRSLLSLTQSLYDYVPPAWWVLVPGCEFEFSETFSSLTENSLIEVLEKIKKLTLGCPSN